jgi:ABC-type lipoprotein export system ATPase subunit
VRDPAILLADEPAGQLNDPSDGDIAGLLASFARSDRIVTVASRDTRWTYYAQQCVRIENGCVASEERNI